MIGIYKITSPLGKVYVGSSKEIERRFIRYKRLQCKKQSKLYNSLIKYGVENHIFDIIEICNIEDLYIKEFEYGTKFNVLDREVGLNLRLPDPILKKIIISEEHRENISKGQRGKKASKEAREKMRISQTGRKHSEDTKIKMRLNNNNIKKILNTETDIIYNGTKKAGEAIGMNRHTLKNKLNGSKKNNTSLIYID